MGVKNFGMDFLIYFFKDVFILSCSRYWVNDKMEFFLLIKLQFIVNHSVVVLLNIGFKMVFHLLVKLRTLQK